MTNVDELVKQIRKLAPAATAIEVDAPVRGGGTWWVDVRLNKSLLTIGWNASMGFGVTSLPSGGYGHGPDEFYGTPVDAAARVAELLATKKRTQPADRMTLKRLREAQRLSQGDMARRLHVSQAAVSKMERSPSPNLKVLQQWVMALGGQVQVQARFGERTVLVDVDPR